MMDTQYKDTLSRCQYTDIFLKEDDTIFIPPYWRYAIKFIDTCSIALITSKSNDDLGNSR